MYLNKSTVSLPEGLNIHTETSLKSLNSERTRVYYTGSNPNSQQQHQPIAGNNNNMGMQQQQQQAVPVTSGVFPPGLLAGTAVVSHMPGAQQGQLPMMQVPSMYVDSSNVQSMVSNWNQHGGVPLFQPAAVSAAQPAPAQSHVSGESQVSHATNRAGQMHASGSSSQLGIAPIPTEPVKLPKALNSAVGKVESMHHSFFIEYPEVWRKLQTSKKSEKDWELIAKHYVIWYVKKIQQKKKLLAEEKARKEKEGAERSAEELKRKTMSAQSILEERVQKRIKEAEASMLQKFPPISAPKTDEEARFVPPLRLQSLVRKVCGDRVKLATETDSAIEQLTEKFVGDAIAFAISMARRKKLKEVDPSDIALFLKSTWNINIPGFSSGKVATYRCIAPKPEERAKIAAVRKENFAEGKKYQVTGNQGDKDRSIKK